MLSEMQKAQLRRHLRYGPIGNTLRVDLQSYRFFVFHGLLEARMGQLSDVEEDILLGTSQTADPQFVVPNSNPAQTIFGYLAIVNWTEQQITPVSDNLDTKQAGEWYSRLDEFDQRVRLYRWWASRMAEFLYLPVNTQPWQGPPGALIN